MSTICWRSDFRTWMVHLALSHLSLVEQHTFILQISIKISIWYLTPVSGPLFLRGFVAFESIYLYLVWLHLYKPCGQQVTAWYFFNVHFSFSCDLLFQRYERAQVAVENWEVYISATTARRQTYFQCQDQILFLDKALPSMDGAGIWWVQWDWQTI